jgi:hypothetical protein
VLRSIILLCSGAVVVWLTCSGNLTALKKICSVQMSSPLGVMDFPPYFELVAREVD